MLQLYGCHCMWYVLILYVVTQYSGMEEWICQMPEFTQTNKRLSAEPVFCIILTVRSAYGK